jgi:hypothetical protein
MTPAAFPNVHHGGAVHHVHSRKTALALTPAPEAIKSPLEFKWFFGDV